MMHPALVTLLRLQLYGKIRNGIQKLKTLRGAFYFVMMLLLFGLWIGPQIVVAIMQANENPERFKESAENFRIFLPYAMLLFCLASVFFSSSEKAIYFRPHEIDFLFPGPFHRRELLIYKISTLLFGSIFPALIFSCFLLRFVHHWYMLFIGAYLGLCFIVLFGMFMLLLRHNISQRAFTNFRKGALAVFIVIIASAGYLVLTKIDPQTLWQWFKAFPDTKYGEIILFPLLTYRNTMMAETFAFFLLWSVVGLAFNLLLLFMIIRLDANFMEAALHISRKIYQRANTAKKSGRVTVFTSKKEAKRSIPMLPRWKGAGPILWRQMLSAFRNAKTLFVMLPIFCIALGPTLANTKNIEQSEIWFMMGIIIWLSIFFTQWVAFDFRAEIDRMEWLKQLPVSSMAVALGEILVPTAIYAIFELLLFIGLSIFLPEMALPLLIAILFIIPVNFMIFGAENFIFLLYPIRMVQSGTADFQHMGRIMLFFLLKVIVIVLTLGLSALIGFLFYYIFMESMIAAIAGAWVMIVLCSLTFLPLTTWAYNRFDLSIHTPS